MGPRRRIGSFLRRHRLSIGLMLLVGASLFAFALFWFAPWQLFIDKTVDEAVPSAGAPASGQPGEPSDPGRQPQPSEAAGGEGVPQPSAGGDQPAGGTSEPVVLARGEFRSLEHESSGTALVIALADGSRILRFEDLATSNGPDLQVYITDQPLSEDWHVWDDGEFVDLGPLKGNIGNQNYVIPPGVELTGFPTAVVWCDRFDVGFAVAPIEQS